jgi:hypothetical protein
LRLTNGLFGFSDERTVFISRIYHASYMPHSSHTPSFDGSPWCKVGPHTMKFIIMQLASSFSDVTFLRLRHLLVLVHLQSALPLDEALQPYTRTSLKQKRKWIYASVWDCNVVYIFTRFKNTIFQDMKPCTLVEYFRHFRVLPPSSGYNQDLRGSKRSSDMSVNVYQTMPSHPRREYSSHSPTWEYQM